MALRWLLYVIMALSLSGFLGVGWVAMHPPVQPPVPPPVAAAIPPVAHPHVVILIAARPLRAGALLGPDDLAGREIEQPAPDMVTDTPTGREIMLGGMVRHNLGVGTVLHDDSVLRPKDGGFLAAVLEPGMRAVSVGIDPVSGAAGLIWPGDRVDIVLTQSVDNSAQLAARRVSGETMLTGLRVVAIDQQLMQGMVGSEGAEHAVRTVTLEVTSAQAERIAVGARLGHLSLAVRASQVDQSSVAAGPPTVTWAGDVSSAVADAKSGQPLRIYNGPDKTEEMHF